MFCKLNFPSHLSSYCDLGIGIAGIHKLIRVLTEDFLLDSMNKTEKGNAHNRYTNRAILIDNCSITTEGRDP